MKFHHLGVACENVAAEIACFEALGYRCEGDIFRDPLQKVDGVFMTGPGPRLELLAPADDASPLRSWLSKGVKYYHQAFEVASLEDALAGLLQRGIMVGTPEPSVALNGRRIAFVMLPGMILLELIQMEAIA